jgi:cyclohexanone monooxygenase
VEWIADCIHYMRANNLDTIEPTEDAQQTWGAHVNELANETLFPQADSWYMGANIPGKPRVFLPYTGGVGPYRERCAEIAEKGYEGFVMTRDRQNEAVRA